MAKNSINLKALLISFAIGLSCFLIWWIYSNIEKVQGDTTPRTSFEAKMKPFLALSEFLELHDYTVKHNVSWSQLDDIDAENTVLVIPFLPQHLPLSQQRKFNQLLENGHIFVGIVPQYETSFFDDIVVNQERQQNDDDKQDNKTDSDENEMSDDTYYQSEFLDNHDLTIYQEEDEIFGESKLMQRQIEFELPNNWMLSQYEGDDEYQEYSYSILTDESSKLLILPEFFIFNNKHIGNKDNALLFLSLLEFEDPEKTHNNIWLLTAPVTPGFFSLIWRYFSEFILALGLLVAFFIWRSSRRFGPSFPLYKKHRKELKEHLDAVGRWHWNSSKSQQLINLNFDLIHRQMKFSYHNWDSYNEAQQIQLITNHTGLNKQKIKDTWENITVNTRLEFIQLMQQLQTIRTKL